MPQTEILYTRLSLWQHLKLATCRTSDTWELRLCTRSRLLVYVIVSQTVFITSFICRFFIVKLD